MDLNLLLEMAASAEPERVAVGGREDGTSYADLQRRARQVGAVLHCSRFERIAVLDLNSATTPLLLFGAAAAGVAVSPLNFRLTDQQLAAAVERLAPVMVVVGPDYVGRIRPSAGVDVVTTTELLRQAVEAEPAELQTITNPESPAVLLATSGTTGPPKEAVLRHRHLTSYIVSSVDFWSAGADEAILVSVPNYHIAGVTSLISSVYSGRRIVMLPQFSSEEWVSAAAAEKVTHAMVVPTMLGRVLDVLEERGETLPHLRHLSYGGGRMPLPVVERALALLPHVGFVNAYGLTETSSTIAILGPEDHRVAAASADPAVRARLGSVGRPLPTLELQVRDSTGAQVPVGASGEIWVRGDQISGEYRSHSALDDEGWYRTRDAGRLDEEQFLFVDGRIDDVIVRGGENLSPGEIEDVIAGHEDVADVAVFGVPDVEWGERVEAAVVVRAGRELSAADLQNFVRERLRSAKVPARVHWYESLPYNETGKLLRRELVDAITTSGTSVLEGVR